MRAKAKAIILTALLWCAASTHAVMAQPDEMADRCAALAGISPDKLATALITYAGKIMGKHPEHWGPIDYANLTANAMSCHGLPAMSPNKVNGEMWVLKLADAQKTNADINARSIAIATAYGQYWHSSEEFPACATFLRWKRDDVWYTNNSKVLFGTAFYDMTPEMLGFYRRIAEECLPVMKAVLDRWHIRQDEAEGIVKSVLSSIEMDALAARETGKDIPDNLLVTWGGNRIPIAYLRPTTQKVVQKIISLEQADRVMPTNSLIQISKWAEQIESEGKDGPDLVYARRIKDIVAEHMFKAVGKMEKRKASAGPLSGG